MKALKTIAYLSPLLALSQTCGATSLTCTGKNSTGTYTATAEFTPQNVIGGNLVVQYQDNHGFQYDGTMIAVDSLLVVGQSITADGPYDGGQMQLNAKFDASQKDYPGTLVAENNAGEPVNVAVVCQIDADAESK